MTANPNPRLLGAHMPTVGGLHNALIAGRDIGCTAVQLFTKNPKQWAAPPLGDEAVAAWVQARQDTAIPFTVAHDSYLINLAAPDPDVLAKSLRAFRAELERAEQLQIPWVVTHMGAHLNQGLEAAIARLIASLRTLLEETDAPGYNVGIALETTAGQGTGLGWKFEEIGQVLAGVGVHPRLGVCLDTCHVFVAGYDLRDPSDYEATWAAFDTHIGRDNLKVIHANDAQKALGSRIDRHAHIGQGEIGADAFRRLVTDPRLAHVPILLETPDSETMHAVNLQKLQRYAAGLPDPVEKKAEAEAESERTVERVSVLLFGHYADITGGDALTLDVPPGATVADAARLLAAQHPRLADLPAHCRFALNEAYTDLAAPLKEGDTLAVLPPMSGG